MRLCFVRCDNSRESLRQGAQRLRSPNHWWETQEFQQYFQRIARADAWF